MSRHPPANLFDLIAARAPHLDKLALETQDATALTYGGLFKRSAQAANALVALGVKPGDRVAVQLEKSTDVIVVTLACLRAGAQLAFGRKSRRQGRWNICSSDRRRADGIRNNATGER